MLNSNLVQVVKKQDSELEVILKHRLDGQCSVSMPADIRDTATFMVFKEKVKCWLKTDN